MPVISNATVATGTGLSTAGNGGRKLVRLANGWMVSAYFETSANPTIYLKVYKPDGNGIWSWNQLCYFTDTSAAKIMSSFAISSIGNKVHIIFGRGNNEVLHSVVNVETQIYEDVYPRNTVDSGQSALGNVSLAINDAGTELHAAWSSKNATYPNSFNIRYAKGTINGDGSVTWGAVEQVTVINDSTANIKNPSIALNGSNASIFAAQEFSSANRIWLFSKSLATDDLPGATTGAWKNKRIFEITTHIQANPSATFVPQSVNNLANGRIWIGWHGKDATDSAKFNVRVSYSDDGGVTWATPVKLTSGNLYDRQNVSLAADKTGKVFALYEEHQWSPDLDIYMRTYNGSWGAPVAVAEADPAAESNPSALVDYSLQMTTPPFVFMSGTDGIKFSGNFNVGAAVSPASGALGNKETATLTAYTVTPEAGSTVTQIVEKVNGVTVNTFNNPASLSRTLTVPAATWDTLAYFASHTASVTVTDSNGATTVTTYSFDKTLGNGASLLEAEKANRDAKNRMRSQLDAIGSRVGVANGSSTNQIISAIDARNVVKRQNGTAVVSGGQIVVNTLGFLPKTITIRSSATQNGTYSELLGTNESRNGTTITQNAFTNITATGFTALISGTNVTWEAQG